MKKFGFFGNPRIQRYRCKQCGKCHSDIPERPLDELRIDLGKGLQCFHMLVEGVGVRACERLLGISRETVLNILKVGGHKCSRLLDAKLRNIPVEQVQVDELYGFVQCKQANTTADDMERGDQYTYLSLERDTKLIINFLVGKRSRENCGEFMEDLKDRVTGIFQLSSDGYKGYVGHLGAVFQTFKNDIHYGFEVKHFATDNKGGDRRSNPVKCQWTKRVPMIGEPDRAMINISHSERLNLSARLFNRRLTRLTLGYSKKLANLKLAMAMFVAHYNFCRPHSSLSKAGQPKRTPAMAAGITNRIWKITDLLELSGDGQNQPLGVESKPASLRMR